MLLFHLYLQPFNKRFPAPFLLSGIPAELELIEKMADEFANPFQRSSSCIEGRNGQLALQHHGLHRFSQRKRTSLTAVHIWIKFN
ncbi:MAG: DUF6399 domain-containing protein [Desulfotignum sp.]|nr:DUF6399 domain-containing protein [Desulfotignum sp.]MCF8089018.1 DUF6399 domain-containing protein [Desulfotignum sp.]MCF8137117.1 DUF6399 domain-containing protein [Desulfotignum sp.]